MQRRKFLQSIGVVAAAAVVTNLPSVAQATLYERDDDYYRCQTIYPVAYADLIEHAKVRHDRAWKDVHYKSGELNIPLSLMDANVPQLHDFLPILMLEHTKLAQAQGKKVRLVVDKRHLIMIKVGRHPVWKDTMPMGVRMQADEIFVRMTPYPMKGEKDKDMVLGYFTKSRLGRKQLVATLVPLNEVA